MASLERELADEFEDREDADPQTRGMPMSLVIDPPADLRLMQEEIFGPILPIVAYDDLDAAVDGVNAGERPLGLYVFGDDAALVNRIVDGTHSGGVTVNSCALQGALPSLGFGGSGTGGNGGTNNVSSGSFDMSNSMNNIAQSAAGISIISQNNGFSSLIQQSVNVQSNMNVGGAGQ